MSSTDSTALPVAALCGLIDRQAISELVHRCAWATDRHDGVAVAELFSADGVLHVRTADGAEVEHTGRPEIAGRIAALDRYRSTSHSVANHVVDLDGDRATARTRCTAHHFGGTQDAPFDRIAYLRYEDELVRDGTVWRFQTRRVHIEVEEHRAVQPYHWGNSGAAPLQPASRPAAPQDRVDA